MCFHQDCSPCISPVYFIMKPANCVCPQSASLLPADHNLIIGYHVRVNVRYMRLQYNIASCKVAIIWLILCQRLRPMSVTVRGETRRTCRGASVGCAERAVEAFCINYSILILVLKCNKPSALAIGLQSDAV